MKHQWIKFSVVVNQLSIIVKVCVCYGIQQQHSFVFIRVVKFKDEEKIISHLQLVVQMQTGGNILKLQ